MFNMFTSLFNQQQILTVVSDIIARIFDRPVTTRAEALDMSKASDRVWQVGILYKCKTLSI